MRMLRSGRTLGLGLAIGMGATLSGVYPTERSEQVRVVIDSIPELLRGEVWGPSAHPGGASGAPPEDAETS